MSIRARRLDFSPVAVALAAVLLLIVAVWLMSLESEPVLAPAGSPDAPGAMEIAVEESPSGEVRRDVVDETAPPAIENCRRVIVVDAVSRHPVADAQIHFADEFELERNRRDGAWWYVFEDPEAVLAERGHPLRSDVDGAVLLPSSDGITFVCARNGAAFGMDLFHPNELEEDQVEIELYDDASFLVMVVDEAGNPRPDVPVRLVEYWSGIMHPVFTTISQHAASPGDPHIEIPHARWLMRHGESFDLRPAIVGFTGDPVSVDPLNLPVEPIRVVTPNTSRVHVRVVDPDGSPHVGQVTVMVQWGGYHFGNETRRVTETGAVTFEHVAVDGTFSASVHVDGWPNRPHHVSYTDVRAPGSEVTVTAQLEDLRDLHPTLTGRVLGVDGRPLASCSFVLDEKPPRQVMIFSVGGHLALVETDESGRFESLLVKPPGRRIGSSLSLWPRVPDLHQERDTSRRVDFDLPESLVAGPLELGDLRLREIPVLVAGRVVRADGQPVAGADVTATVRRLNESNPLAKLYGADRVRPGRAYTLRTTSQGDGSFVVHQSSEDTAGTIWALHAGYPTERLGFEKGQEGLVLELPVLGELRTNVLLDRDVPVSELRLSLRRGKHGHTLTSLGDGGFVARQVATGTYRLIFGIWDEDQSLFEIPQVAVSAEGQSDDPRLIDVDLRGRISVARIEIVDDAGKPIADAQVVVPARGMRAPSAGAYGRLTLATGRPALDCFVFRRGYRYRQLEGLRGDVRVTLPAGIPVRVVPGRAIPDRDFSVGLVLERVPPEPDPLAPFRRWVNDEWAGLESESAVVAVPESGDYSAVWRVAGPGGVQSAEVEGTRQVLAIRDATDEQTFELPLPDELLSSALQQLKK